MDMTDITEFDCVEVGDFCSINALAALQTHLYEDRVMKVGRVNVGQRRHRRRERRRCSTTPMSATSPACGRSPSS